MGRAFEVRAAAMAKTAAFKSKHYAKYGVAIYKAARSGVPDPETNQTLKKEIEKARKANIPSAIIQRAIDKAKGGLSGAFQEVRYEGFGPNNSLIIVDCVTDNVNRTFTDIRTAFTKSGCKLGVSGSVSHMFDHVSVFAFEGLGAEAALDILLGADCEVEDIDADEGMTSVVAPATEYQKIKDALLEADPEMEFIEDGITFLPKMKVTLEAEDDIKQFQRLLAQLRELDDVEEIYHNVEGMEE